MVVRLPCFIILLQPFVNAAAIEIQYLRYYLRAVTVLSDGLHRNPTDIAHNLIRYLSTVNQPLLVHR
jgi:hypothetical protein